MTQRTSEPLTPIFYKTFLYTHDIVFLQKTTAIT